MRTAIISDVHGNLAALEAVLADVQSQSPDDIFCLGDTVGYGPQPLECLEIVRATCSLVLMGNHEYAILYGSEQFTPLAQVAIDWTARVLRRHQEILDYISGLSPETLLDSVRFVHGSIRDPLLDYVREADSPWAFLNLINTLRDDFEDFNICFVGHNHRAFLGTGVGYIFPHDAGTMAKTRFHIGEEKAYVSIGSVGQPRDGDWRASWVMFDGGDIEYRRVEYDREKTISLIRACGLPEFLAERLRYGN
ncbi:MAG: metallophosphoesterase [Planctomycetota bacterium]|jgi:diadenosine tetraphosphatase ApaH/serine/threonine PP2A family protein phosphatase|nr:metallophosphoesterase [Planctomycetota bacterium]